MAHDAKAQKQQMMLTENVRTLIPKMAVPTIVPVFSSSKHLFRRFDKPPPM